MSDELLSILDRSASHLENAETREAFDLLGPELSKFARNNTEPSIREEVARIARSHRLFDMIMQDPYSHRAFHKPRGYAGDAEMLDYLYDGQPPIATSTIGRRVFSGTALGPMGRSVAFRKQLLVSQIDHTLLTAQFPRILSVAAGHLREISGTVISNDAMQDWSTKCEVVAFDQDPLACAIIEQTCRAIPVVVVCESVRKLLAQETRKSLGDFDLIYCAGLFDYLSDSFAGALIGALVPLLRRNGRLLIGNFAPTSWGYGYMELMLDWKLTYRGPDDLSALGSPHELKMTNRFVDPFRNVAYVEWAKAA